MERQIHLASFKPSPDKFGVPKETQYFISSKKVTMKLKHIISTNVKLASKDDLVSSLLSIMQDTKISSIIIVDLHNHPIGIFTEFDAMKVVASSVDIINLTVKDVISSKQLFTLDEDTEIHKAFEIMQDKHLRHIIAVDHDRKIKGIATQSDFLRYLDTDILIKLKTSSDVMTKNVITITDSYTLSDAASIMLHHKISSLIVTDENNYPVGIITERDMVSYANKKTSSYTLNDVMSKPLQTIKEDEPLTLCVSLMEDLKIRRIAVVNEAGRLVGIVTRHDILKSIQSKKIEILSQSLKQKNYELEIIKKQDEELKLLDIALKSSANAVIITDIDTTIKWCNHAFEELTGYTSREIIGKRPKQLIGSGLQTKEFYEILWNTILSKKSFKGEIINKKKNGSLYNEKLTITPIIDENHEISHFVAIKEDITSIKNMQKSLIESEARFKNLFDHAPLPYQSLDEKGNIIEVNNAWLEFSGYKYHEVIGTFIGRYLTPNHLNIMKCNINELLNKGEVKHKTFEFITKNGDIKIIELNGKTSKDPITQKIYTHCLISDITEKKAMQDKMHYIAHHDILTSLPNKVFLQEQINQAIIRANRNNTKIALLIIGLDRFQDINDSFGHIIGDELLILVANYLQTTEATSNFIARLSGDEFGVLIEDIKHQEDCAIIANKLISQLNTTYVLSNNASVYLSATVGISIYPNNALNAQALLQHSDAALYLAKREERGSFRFYNNDLTKKARKSLELSSSLQKSILNDEFIVLYQPQVDVKSGKIIGAESLVRWQYNSTLINPDEFISLAEERGLISGISQFVIKQSCTDLKQFLKVASSDFKLSVNISSLELSDIGYKNNLSTLIKKYGIKPENIGIEVTETIFIKDIKEAIISLKNIKDEGFLISLDDFGTGYSSLSYLKKLPLDILKIDKSFIDGLPYENDDIQIVKTIISMAKTLGLKVLAEGVETKEQLDFLEKEGCDYYQGYYFSKPVNIQDFIKLL
ncbi:EAL domain-containing protein [Arcobacter sp. FWKO B]|uniref:EAL domain-containing protein n=1 Tax=Arcobacter sp. FWKO B TaxID=2593672 RepID=UPI0018A57EF8|nr:EAL domain-containing protein [Arcobacter sp. FWKO B]QOG12822.1 EAL domain-containing protein [Arcobacter sp. FWKO B]